MEEVKHMANTKHPLQSLLDNADLETRSYSGRAMYGRNCLGVELDSLGDFFEKLGEALLEQGEDIDRQDRWKITEGLRSAKWDNMGLGMIVYFTSVPYTDEEGDEEDEEDEEGESPETV